MPAATYRLQLDPAQIDFDLAADLAPYLAELGVTHAYASPITRPRAGSPHGYDVVDAGTVNPELGGRAGLDRWVQALREAELGLVVDIVPNHMAIGAENAWWTEVLRHGPTAPHAGHLDLFWDPDDTLILPLLGRPYADCLTDGELTVAYEGSLYLAYWDHRFPVDPATYPLVLAGLPGLEAVERAAARVTGAEGEERVRRGETVDGALEVAVALDDVLEHLAALDVDRIHELAEAQHYRLAWWQLSRERLGHRRFFTITELIGVRQEQPEVFEDTHRLLADLVSAEMVDGVRVDHIDGLREPQEYLEQLRALLGDDRWLVVEKILAEGEALPEGWPVEGTTGYDYLDVAGKLAVDPDGLASLGSLYRRVTGSGASFADLVHDQKLFIITERLGPETARFAAALERLARQDRWARDVIPSDLIRAAIELVACLPVYRTYVRRGEIPEADRAHVEAALADAVERRPDLDPRAFTFLRRVFLLDHTADLDTADRQARSDFVEQVQQLTGAVMAKGVEDTAFYQHNLLISLNEVGSHPEPFPDDPVATYHDHNRWMATHQPRTMTTASTHDTKRSEDVRARIAALSQVAEAWGERVEAWHQRNRRHRGSGEAGSVPTRNEELFIYQTLVGSWPLDPAELGGYADRLDAHLVKAAREAKIHTEWLDPDPVHEEALSGFVRGLVGDEEFCDELVRFAEPVWRAGAADSIAQAALRLTAPGVPDLYRGCELWDLSLTDPDNRRPVDWERRRRIASDLASREPSAELCAELVDGWKDGRIKLHLHRQVLRLRRQWPEVLRDGDYLPLVVEGDRAEHLVAFARRAGDRWVVTAAPRLTLNLTPEGELWPREGWEGTRVLLPEEAPGSWQSVLDGTTPAATDGALDASILLASFPLAVLTGG